MALAAMSVQVGTVMQLSPVVAARRAAHARFVQEALGIADPSVPLPVGALSSLQCVFSRLWSSLRWENEHKEAWWRLTVDGVPLLGNSHMRGARPAACGCGGFPGGGPDWASPRGHHFWACPVAQAVLDHLALAVGRPVSRADVWLVQAPEATRQCVWDVVVLAAVSAMEGGRRFMAAAQRGGPGRLSWPGSAGAGDHPCGGHVLEPAAGVCGPRASQERVGFGGPSPSVLAGGFGCAGVLTAGRAV